MPKITEFMGFRRHLDEVIHGPEERVDVLEVGNVVAKVLHGALEDGGEPDGADAQVPEVLQARRDAGNVTDTVAIGILSQLMRIN